MDFNLYKRYHGMNNVITSGDAKREMSKNIVSEWTWYEDPSATVGYFFDTYHEFDPFALNDIDIDNVKDLDGIIPVDIKYIINQSQTLAKDQISYHIQFKPSFDVAQITDYYKEYFIDRYSAIAPCGLYVLIKDTNGKYNRWMVVAPANHNDTLFPTFDILRCDYTLNYVLDGKVYDYAVVLRSQSSYNQHGCTIEESIDENCVKTVNPKSFRYGNTVVSCQISQG